MLELIKAGGWVMLPIILLAVLALAIILERFWTLRRKEVMPPGLGEEVREWARGRHGVDPRRFGLEQRFRPVQRRIEPCRVRRRQTRGRRAGHRGGGHRSSIAP